MRVNINNKQLFKKLKDSVSWKFFYMLEFIENERKDNEFMQILSQNLKGNAPNLIEIKQEIQRINWNQIFSGLSIEPGTIRRQTWNLPK